MSDFFTKELFYRLGSIIIFVPAVILPLIYNNYLSVIIFLFITWIIGVEINQMKNKINSQLEYFAIEFSSILLRRLEKS